MTANACVLYTQVELHEYIKVGKTLYTTRHTDRIELVPHRTLTHKVFYITGVY